MAEAVYILCSLTSVACAALLLRSYLRRRVRLLLWCGLCFLGLTVSNVLLFLDLAVLPQIDLSLWRSLATLIALIVLIYGLVWDAS
ncbi:MAG: hypothetical protein KJ077_05780 [Anaerolineae bacterium]|nr:hypothetical protein [Anaerolineae bacterium]